MVAIAAGTEFSIALKADGTIVVWGENSSGQINVPEGSAKVVAIAASWGTGFYLAPIIILPKQATATSVALDASTNLSVTVLSSGQFSSMWSFNGIPISGATVTNLALSNIDITKTGLYSITASNLSSYLTVGFVLELV